MARQLATSFFGHGNGHLDVPAKLLLPDGRWILVIAWTPTVQAKSRTTVTIEGILMPPEEPA